ncbi:protein yippee-like At3g55890 [Solanum dulcamara]|uniref:protein yippee-like At3g55890 n=1 Tax=Solanum dulcamara TaxID=45834 RepID=UPI002484FEBF|nr:protein yippee-like At3g55890 [Solanum dulcamara]
MGKTFLVEYDGRPSSDYFHCSRCSTRVAFIADYIEIDVELPYVPQGIFTKMFNVEVPEGESYHEVKDDMTLTDTYCIECRDRLGWKLIEVPQDCWYEEGQFLMMLDKLSYCNGQLLAHNQAGCANEGNADQEGGANEGNADQVGGTNEGNADQEGGANELVPNDQDGGGNEENVDQDGGGNEQDGVSNEQVPNGHY